MDRTKLEQLLQTEQLVRHCGEAIVRQAKLVRYLEQQRLDAAEAKRLLDMLQRVRLLHVKERDRLLAELGLPD